MTDQSFQPRRRSKFTRQNLCRGCRPLCRGSTTGLGTCSMGSGSVHTALRGGSQGRSDRSTGCRCSHTVRRRDRGSRPAILRGLRIRPAPSAVPQCRRQVIHSERCHREPFRIECRRRLLRRCRGKLHSRYLDRSPHKLDRIPVHLTNWGRDRPLQQRERVERNNCSHPTIDSTAPQSRPEQEAFETT